MVSHKPARSVSSSQYYWANRQSASPAWCCVLSRDSSTNTRRARLVVSEFWGIHLPWEENRQCRIQQSIPGCLRSVFIFSIRAQTLASVSNQTAALCSDSSEATTLLGCRTQICKIKIKVVLYSTSDTCSLKGRICFWLSRGYGLIQKVQPHSQWYNLLLKIMH